VLSPLQVSQLQVLLNIDKLLKCHFYTYKDSFEFKTILLASVTFRTYHHTHINPTYNTNKNILDIYATQLHYTGKNGRMEGRKGGREGGKSKTLI
jgi:hypothetical protein